MTESHRDNKMIILDILKKSSAPVSGEELSRITAISRVGVWKHIKSLKEHGYEIYSSRNGYSLKQGKDLLQKWEFPRYKDRIYFFPEIDSTMKKAREAALEGAENRTIIAAEKQTHGIDRKGDKWESDKGGLYFTIILRPDIPLSCFNLITLGAAAGISSYLKKLGINSCCRWPNNVMADGRKIAGVLTEVSGLPDRIEYALAGIGFNINNVSSGISLKDILNTDFPRKKALDELLSEIFRIYDSGFHQIPELWSSCISSKNEIMQFKTGEKTVKGIFDSITREGNLLIKSPDGKKDIIIPGDEIIH